MKFRPALWGKLEYFVFITAPTRAASAIAANGAGLPVNGEIPRFSNFANHSDIIPKS
jgi:hypothetical protein